jgi:ribosomal protein S18 acetylase RimI-like enzyme
MILKFTYRLWSYLKHHLREKWRFTYFELNITNEFLLSHNKSDSNISIKLADVSDLDRIKKELLPYVESPWEINELLNFEENYKFCFLAESNDKIIHYAIVYIDAINSPLMSTTIPRKLVGKNNAYLGTSYTIPSERGVSVHYEMLMYILTHLLNTMNIKWVINFVHDDTLGAVRYYRRLGFNQIYRSSISNFLFKYLK